MDSRGALLAVMGVLSINPWNVVESWKKNAGSVKNYNFLWYGLCANTRSRSEKSGSVGNSRLQMLLRNVSMK